MPLHPSDIVRDAPPELEDFVESFTSAREFRDSAARMWEVVGDMLESPDTRR